MIEFKDNLRRIRRSKDITQFGLSRRTGLHQTQISHFERGDRKPSFDNLLALAKALGCTIDELAGQ